MKPTVFLFSEPCALSLFLLEKLLSNFCRIVVFSGVTKTWEHFTSHIVKSGNLIFDARKNYSKFPKPDYFLLVDLSATVNRELFEKAEALADSLNAKGFAVVSEKNLLDVVVKLSEAVGLIAVNNLFGPRMELDETSEISQIIGAAVRGEKIKVAVEEKTSLVHLGDAAKLIVKWLFSFGPYGEVTTISSSKTYLAEICQSVRQIYPNFEYQVVKQFATKPMPGKKKTYLLERGNNQLLAETLIWFKNNPLPKAISAKPKTEKWRLVKMLVVGLSVVLAIPFVFTLTAGLFLFASMKMASQESIGTARVLLNASYVTADLADKETRTLTRIPVLGKWYTDSNSLAYILKNTGLAGIRVFNLLDEASLLSGNILQGREYDIVATQEKIISDLGYVETKLSFIEGEAKNYPNFHKFAYLHRKIDFLRLKKLVSNTGKIARALPDLLGAGKRKTYLVLLQNNMELRPTGGFIGSFALVSFGLGKLDEVSVQDVYAADGQLKGHVEPPTPIKKYLNQANWFLRDSNWDPNFPVSAERAEWFLDKEIDVPVDGVVALDLNTIKDLLEVVGPIYLNDFQTQVSGDNFYEKTQSEVEESFFPGSTKKANFITALSKEMINVLILNKDENGAKLARIIYNNLEARHIQIFLHNNLAKEGLANLNWDGAFNYPDCTGNCYSDLLGLVEANLGVNKANYYVERKYDLSVSLQDGLIKKNLSVEYKNNANLAMGESGIYKSYSRLTVPLNSNLEFIKVGDVSLAPDIETVSGRKEIGFYFELMPGQTKTVNISWRLTSPLNLSRAGEYRIYVRKQAGTPAEPISIFYNGPAGVDLKVEPGYNTLFTQDIYSKATWKK